MECGQRDHTVDTGHHQEVLQALALPALPQVCPQHPQKDVTPDSSVSMLEAGLSASILLCSKVILVAGQMFCYLNTGFDAEQKENKVCWGQW